MSWPGECIPSLRFMWRRWVSTVLRLMQRAPAISREELALDDAAEDLPLAGRQPVQADGRRGIGAGPGHPLGQGRKLGAQVALPGRRHPHGVHDLVEGL